jgi:Uncharacterised nucleotidyltransferase
MPSGVRFWPPDTPLDSGVHWSLLRAFGPTDAPAPTLKDHSAAIGMARRMGVLMRIFTRCPKALLREELQPIFDEVMRPMRVSAARGLALERTLRTVDEEAFTLKTRFALIKGSAIVRVTGASLSLRGACDIDILLEPADAARLHAALKFRGFSEKTPTHPHYHLPMLIDGAGGALEIHASVPYVQLSRESKAARLRDLLDQGLAESAPGLSQYVCLPKPEFLLAHCLAHGIAQHGYIPHSYPLLRMLADAMDLGLLDNADRTATALGWISSVVSEAEVAALREVAQSLVQGAVQSLWTSNGASGRMLRHMAIGCMDDQYVNGLKVFQALHSLRTLGLATFLREYGHMTFALADQDVPRIYGHSVQGKELKYKLLRPFDVLARIARMMPNALRIAVRQGKHHGPWRNQLATCPAKSRKSSRSCRTT